MSINLRQLVSRKKKRYEDGEFNLDLSYITPQIIAMGFPAETLERIYRNDISEVARFLEAHHSDRYKVYNLCAERSYNHARFKDRVEQFGMQDHNPPLIHTIPYFCKSVYKWLQSGKDYVAAIHCKAGKGRTGVMISCYLLYESYQGIHDNPPTYLTADDVLDLYDKQRTHNGKGVTIPSQRRYVYYYAHTLRHSLSVESCPLVLHSITLEGGQPVIPPSGGCSLMFRCKKLVRDCHQDNRSTHRPIGASEVGEARSGQASIVLKPAAPIPVNGDVKVLFYQRSLNRLSRYDKIFHCWFNTFFVVNQPSDTPGARWRQERGLDDGYAAAAAVTESDGGNVGHRDIYLTLTKAELDKACKDRLLPETFSATLRFSVPESHSDDDDASGPYRSFAYTPQATGAAAAAAAASAAAASAAAMASEAAGGLDDVGTEEEGQLQPQQHQPWSSSSCSSQTDDSESEKAPQQQEERHS